MSSRLRDFRPAGSGSATGLMAPSCLRGVNGERRRPPEACAVDAGAVVVVGGPKLSQRGRAAATVGRPRFSTADLDRGRQLPEFSAPGGAAAVDRAAPRSMAEWQGMKESFSRLVVGKAVSWDMLSKERRASAVVGDAI